MHRRWMTPLQLDKMSGHCVVWHLLSKTILTSLGAFCASTASLHLARYFKCSNIACNFASTDALPLMPRSYPTAGGTPALEGRKVYTFV